MRYVVVGAGAVGGSIGAALFAAGNDVVLVARGPHGAAVAAHGLRFTTPRGETLLPVPSVSGPDEMTLRPGDVLLLAVKVQDSIGALDRWSPQPVQGGGTAGTVLPLICAQNGVEGERLALRRFENVYGACVMLPAAHLRAGEIEAYGDPLVGVLTIGRYPDGSDDTVDRVCADLEASGVGARASHEVMRWKYAKLLANLGNALEAVVGPVSQGAALDVFARARNEGEQALRAAGIDFTDDREMLDLQSRTDTVDIPGRPRGGGSTWQSLTRATGNVESDYLSGEVVLLGRQYGVPTPVNETLRRLAGELAHRHLPPGSMAVDELVARLPAV